MSNLSKADDVPTGLHYWCIRKLWTDRNGWVANLFAVVFADGHFEFVENYITATKFKTRDDAEQAAFNMTISAPDLIQKLKVELV